MNVPNRQRLTRFPTTERSCPTRPRPLQRTASRGGSRPHAPEIVENPLRDALVATEKEIAFLQESSSTSAPSCT